MARRDEIRRNFFVGVSVVAFVVLGTVSMFFVGESTRSWESKTYVVTDFRTITGEEMQDAFWYTGFEQKLHRAMCHQWCLFRRFCENGIAACERSCDLARKNSQREIPRADADKHTTTAHAQLISFAGWAGQVCTVTV